MRILELNHLPHPAGMGGTQATIKFKNKYSASVISGQRFYSDAERPWEIAVIGPNGHVAYNTPITDDVCGYLTDKEADDILAQIEALPAEGE